MTRSRLLSVAQIVRQKGITQGEISEAVGASQPQISRILSGRALKKSRLMEEVCLYVERQTYGVTADSVHANQELIEAVRTAWDGSASNARALSIVIRSLSTLRGGPL